MTVKELMKELRAIVKVHPDAGKADIRISVDSKESPARFIGFDTKHKPARITISDR